MREKKKILRAPEVQDKVGLSGPSIWRRENQGDFPKRISLGGHSVGWLESEVDEWLQKKADERKGSSGSEGMDCR